MTSESEQYGDPVVYKTFKILIDNWPKVRNKDKKEILSSLENLPAKRTNRAEDDTITIESILKTNPKTNKVTVDLKNLKAIIGVNAAAGKALSNILQNKDRENPVHNYQNSFNKMQFDSDKEAGNVPQFTLIENSTNPKEEILSGLNAELKEAQKAVDNNRSLAVKAGVKKRELMLGEKAQKILSTFTELKEGHKRTSSKTKTKLVHNRKLMQADREHKVKLLKDIQKYLQQDQSEPFDFKKFNESVRTFHNHYRNALTSLHNSQATKEAEKAHEKEVTANNKGLSKKEITEKFTDGMFHTKQPEEDIARKDNITKATASYRIDSGADLAKLRTEKINIQNARADLAAAREKVFKSGLTPQKNPISPPPPRSGGWGR